MPLGPEWWLNFSGHMVLANRNGCSVWTVLCIILKPVVKLHETYQNFVIEQLQQHYAGGLLVLVNKDWPLITKLWITNLADITTSLRDLYCSRGPAPRDPASMLRSFLLFLLAKPEIGITAC
ncbi:MAG: hypothetical protein VR68_00780 [Peptococcaceae bacterium BRH_c4a]|nr:MAG: hypothetical protein VR68_00780 [Peptococcaceae bacterium BRH_c4a]